jgi:hypothetical protein
VADENRQVLVELYRDACDDGVHGDLAKWVFREAKANARREIADRRLKRLDSEDFSVRCRAWGMDMESARQLVMAHAPDDIQWHKAEAALSDAIEEVSVCGRMVALLSKSPPAQRSNAPARTGTKG